MGRPLADIDVEQVKKLARIGCTQAEIAEILGCSQQTISDRFSVEYASARASLKMSVRRAQVYRGIKAKSDTMLIHLGKVYCGQTDRLDVTSDGKPVQPIFELVGNDSGNQGVPTPAETA